MYEDLDKLIDSVKSHPIRYICLIIFLGIAIPLFIQFPYWVGNYIVLIKTDFKASDMLSFSGNFLTFIATTSLGILALWQNKTIQKNAKLENEKLQEQNEKLREQDIERYKLEVMSKYYSNVMFCDEVLISTNITGMDTEYHREKDNEIALYKKDDFEGRAFYIMETKFYLKLLNQHFPHRIRINSIALHYNGCSRKYEDNVIEGDDILNLYPRKEYFSPLNISQDNKFKLLATLSINKIPDEDDVRDSIKTESNDIVRKITESKKIYMTISLSIKNPFNIKTTALYIIQLNSTNEIDINKFLKFKVEDITMQLAGLDMVKEN